MDLRVDGKVALVTGAGSGIGAAIARQLANQGATVVVADLEASGGPAVAEEIKGLFLATNLRNGSACRELVDAATGRLGGIDILVNNAGFQHLSPIEDFPEDVWASQIGRASCRE